MIEFPEANVLAAQLGKMVVGKCVERVLPPTKQSKFCWFNGEPGDYESQIKGSKVCGSECFGIYVEVSFDNGMRLCFNDGVNPRFIQAEAAPKDYQLLIVFTDGTGLVFTVAMYGGIVLHDGSYDNEYYLKSRSALSPFSPDFPAYYYKLLDESRPELSLKALLATEQRIPGIGNGVLQDILFVAGLNPRRKLKTLGADERERLLSCIIDGLHEMTDRGGRDTEKDLFGEFGGYVTKMSRNTLKSGCPVCGGPITKEAYLGGSVYYCAKCQPLS